MCCLCNKHISDCVCFLITWVRVSKSLLCKHLAVKWVEHSDTEKVSSNTSTQCKMHQTRTLQLLLYLLSHAQGDFLPCCSDTCTHTLGLRLMRTMFSFYPSYGMSRGPITNQVLCAKTSSSFCTSLYLLWPFLPLYANTNYSMHNTHTVHCLIDIYWWVKSNAANVKLKLQNKKVFKQNDDDDIN